MCKCQRQRSPRCSQGSPTWSDAHEGGKKEKKEGKEGRLKRGSIKDKKNKGSGQKLTKRAGDYKRRHNALMILSTVSNLVAAIIDISDPCRTSRNPLTFCV